MATLTITFDVTGLSREEVEALVAEVTAQAEESEDYRIAEGGHPEAPVQTITTCTTLEAGPDGFIPCADETHDHTEEDEVTGKTIPLVCHDCGVPVFYDSETDRYSHANLADPPCFLSTTSF